MEMATIGASNVTLVDWSKRQDPSGKTAMIIEALEERTPALQDAVTVEGNLPTGHQTTIRTAEPTGTWRQINAGVKVEKSTTRQVVDAVGFLETYSECDAALAELNGNVNSFRWSEDQAFLAGLGKESERAIFWGDHSDVPEEPLGLAPRYQTDSGCDYFIDGGGSGSDNCCMFLVKWGVNTCHLFFPKGSNAGITAEDKGQVTLNSAGDYGSTARQFEGYRTHYAHKFGLSLRDERAVVCVGNIDYSGMISGTDPGMLRWMIQAMNVQKGAPGRNVWYVPEAVKTWLDIYREEKSNLALTLGQWAGEPTTMMWGVPIRVSDALNVYDLATIA